MRSRGHSRCYGFHFSVFGQIARRGIEEIHFAAETFNFSESRTLQFCEALNQADLHLTFTVRVRPDLMNEPMREHLKRPGCFQIHPGIESGNPKSPQWANRKYDLELIRKNVALARKKGIACQAFFILGFPTESIDDMKNTLRYAKSLDLRMVTFSPLESRPGSRMYESSLSSGFLDQDHWRQNTIAPDPDFKIPEHHPSLSLDRIRKVSAFAMFRFHMRQSVI